MELFSLKGEIIWNTFLTSSSTLAAAERVHGASLRSLQGQVCCRVSVAQSRPRLATGFQGHLQIIVQNQKVQNPPQLDSLKLSLIFPVLKVSLVSHISYETPAALSDSNL